VRSYERESAVYDPLHYLALLEHKSRALDQAPPLTGWELPECFHQLRRLIRDFPWNLSSAARYWSCYRTRILGLHDTSCTCCSSRSALSNNGSDSREAEGPSLLPNPNGTAEIKHI
jgi:hypothetical protein